MSENYSSKRYDVFFEIDSNPLKIVIHPIVGKRYCTIDGTVIRLVSAPPVDEMYEHYVVQRSELVADNFLIDISGKVLNLFWTLTRNNYSKLFPYEDNTD